MSEENFKKALIKTLIEKGQYEQAGLLSDEENNKTKRPRLKIESKGGTSKNLVKTMIDTAIAGLSGSTDHGSLSGLADDDHTQYHNDTRGDVRYYTKSQVDTSLGGKADTVHTHAISDVTSLQTTLDGKAATTHTHAISDTTGLQSALDGKSDDNHGHLIADVSGLQTALDGKAATSHAHIIADTTGLQTALDGKAATSHSHVIGDVSGLGTALAAKLEVVTAADVDSGVATDGYVLTADGAGNAAWEAAPGGGVSDGDKGDITVSASGATWTIDNGAVTLAKQADMATASVVYRKTAGSGAPEVQTLSTLKTDLGLTGTNSGDDAVNSLYSGLVSNATHTGDATGATALTVVKIQGKDFPTLSAADDQKYPKYVSGSNAFVMTAIAGGGDVTGDDVSTTTQNIVAYSGTGGKNITELTGTQGDILYHNGTNWAKLGAGTVGQYLETNGSGANPSWSYGAVIHSSKSAGATTTGANVTPVSVTNAVFTYAASAVYRIWVMGRLNSTAATTGAALQFDLSSAVTAIDVFGGNLLASSGTATFFAGVADDTTLGTGSSGVPAGPVDVPIYAHALLVTGANTGTCQLRIRSETTAVTELMIGAVMVVERVA